MTDGITAKDIKRYKRDVHMKCYIKYTGVCMEG